jgi:hypothetical protein
MLKIKGEAKKKRRFITFMTQALEPAFCLEIWKHWKQKHLLLGII